MTGAHGRTVFEIAVRGGIGPVLQRALEPCASTGVEAVTIVRTLDAGAVDLVDLFVRLDCSDIEVADVTVVPRA